MKMNPDLSNLFDVQVQLRTKIVNIENKPNVCDNLEELLDFEDKYDEVVDSISTLVLKTRRLLMTTLEEVKIPLRVTVNQKYVQ